MYKKCLTGELRPIKVDLAIFFSLTEIARAKHLSLTQALSCAVEAYRRAVFMESMSSGYAALRNDPKAWAAEQAERKAWDTTLSDGLDHE